ncbi:uncharacterized protein YjiS (DUF1127 family) [Rhizobium sp. SG570]|nr:uncharacterized protein YjiS (DUF1127 family) [Rhizobium sp. SG570]
MQHQWHDDHLFKAVKSFICRPLGVFPLNRCDLLTEWFGAFSARLLLKLVELQEDLAVRSRQEKTMTQSQLLVADNLTATVNELYQKFGAWRTARALLLVAWRQRQTRMQVAELSNSQLRDIGLPEREDSLGHPNFLPLHLRRFG